MKCKQAHSGFELGELISLPMLIKFMPQAPFFRVLQINVLFLSNVLFISNVFSLMFVERIFAFLRVPKHLSILNCFYITNMKMY